MFNVLPYGTTCLVTRSTLHPLVVPVFPLKVLVYPFILVLICPFVRQLVVSVCSLAVLLGLSVGFFITDNNGGRIKNAGRLILLKIKKHVIL